MIEVAEALERVKNAVVKGEIKTMNVQQAVGFVLAEDVYSNLDLPSFNQSAMDGYAIAINEFASSGRSFKLVGEVKAGDTEFPEIREGECLRIFTGSHVPESVNTVVIQEHVNRTNDLILVEKDIKPGQNVRIQGEQIANGDLALTKETVLGPAAISFLCSMGITEVKVYEKPKIGLILTGNELISPGTPLKKGQVYESNSFAIESVLNRNHYELKSIVRVKDTFEETLNEISKMLEEVDFVLLSGGISVGDYDFVGKALRELGIDEIFYKVRQKPGKPLFFGKIKEKYAFALPGNPASALVCFYQYVLPAINKFSGKKFTGLREEKLILKSNYQKKEGRAEFLKARSIDDEVEILEGQLSHMMHTFAISDGLVFLPSETGSYSKGEVVSFFRF